MKERPILFSGEMVRALLEGRKTQTRRVVKLKGNLHKLSEWPYIGMLPDGTFMAADVPIKVENFGTSYFKDGFKCPYGEIGDRLWVRESFQIKLDATPCGVIYKADGYYGMFDLGKYHKRWSKP